jgi:hypothetical protein
MRFRVLALALAAALASPALAAAPPPPTPTVLMDPVAMPIVVDGKLVNYVFVTIRLRLSPNADPIKLRAMEPYFRDALVRAGHRTPFVRPDNYTTLDDVRLKAALLREAAAIAGPGMVASAQIIREQPKHVDGLPKPAAPVR